MKILICGPCVIEKSIDWLVEQACAIREQIPQGWTFVFKTSFDKANRTRYDSFRGLGLDATMRAFEIIKKKVGCLVTTDVHEPWQAEVTQPLVDIIQIPAMLCRQTDLLRAAAKVAACVNIKCGTNVSPAKMGTQVRKSREGGAPATWLTYRGTAYGDELVFDPHRLWRLCSYAPVIADITHSTADGSDVETKGNRGATLIYGRTAMALSRVDGLFIEAHPDPERALSDAGTQIKISMLRELLEGIMA